MPKKPVPNPKTAVIYARYSSSAQRDVSIDQQVHDIESYAQREGYTIVHVYADHAKSGYKGVDKRLEFLRMMRDAENGTFGTVIAWKVDRFGRNREESTAYKGQLRRMGVNVIYAMEAVPTGASGVLVEGMLEAIAEWYSKNLSENVTRGMRDNAEKGLYNGMKVLGYRRGADGKPEIVPEEAAIIRDVFELYDGGTPVMQITSILNQRGLTTSRGNPYGKNSLQRILRNERYDGVYLWGDLRIEGGNPRIIPHDLFERVQNRMNTSTRRTSSALAPFALTGKLFCGECGSPMIGDSGTSHTGTKHYYYTCAERKRTRSCHKKSVQKDAIEDAVVNHILDHVLTESTISRLADTVMSEYTRAEADTMLSSLRAELAEAQKKQRNLNTAIAAGIFDESTKEMLDELSTTAARLESSIREQEFMQEALLTKDRVMFWMSKFAEGDRTDPVFRSRLIDTFVNSIYLYDDRFRLYINTVDEETIVTFSEHTSSDKDTNGVR